MKGFPILLGFLCCLFLEVKAWIKPKPGIKWQWQIGNKFDWDRDNIPGIELYDIDLYDTSIAEAKRLKENGKILVCYFEAGTWVDYDNRPFRDKFPGVSSIKDKSCKVGQEICDGIGFSYEPPYTNELWFDPKHEGVKRVLSKVLDYAKDFGCDLVETDNVQGFEKDSYCTGFEICPRDKCLPGTYRNDWNIKTPDGKNVGTDVCVSEYNEWKLFNIWLAEESHVRGMGCLLKNTPFMSKDFIDTHDGIVSESCANFNECSYMQQMREAGKPVFMCTYADIKYESSESVPFDRHCKVAAEMKYDPIYKLQKLDNWIKQC